ncbi:MAG: hypothetical protein RLZ71_451 [Actinomycetota bacterium]|jgi:uncharacterized membrane protein (UPF0182 family)
MASKARKHPVRIALVILAIIGVLFVSTTGFYTDVLWYKQLGYSQVFFTQISSKAYLFLAAGLTLGAVVGINVFIANKIRPIYVRPERDVFAAYRASIEKARKLILIGIPVALGIAAGVSAIPHWEDALLFMNATETGMKDPQFGLDASFYLFTLPFLSSIVVFLAATFALSAFVVLLVHLFHGAIRFNGKNSSVTKGARVQIGSLIALFVLSEGANFWLDQYQTMTSPSGLYTGATYADVNAQIPGLQILSVIAVLVAGLFVAAAIVGRWRLPILGTALMVVSSIVLQGVYPWAIQTFQVVPNERTLESEYIKRNIEATRFAYGLDGVEVIDYNAKTTASASDLRNDAETTANIRITDPTLVSESFRQLEQYRQYYGFADQLDVDRYNIGGKVQDTVLAVRELNQSGLGTSQSWFNNTLVYTHGYGIVAAYGNKRASDGQPVFMQEGIPSKGVLGDYEPRIYFGEQSPEYSIVGAAAGSKPKELDYPGGVDGAEQTYTTFTGNGGPKLDNLYTRLAYAIKFGSEQLLLSDSITNDSQILYNRNPLDRVAAVAPYLTLDSDIYPAVVDGRVVWLVDGYTTSSRFPYSRAENFGDATSDSQNPTATGGDLNYIRNSVKATVDAYDGSVKLYAWDPNDPILKTWQKVYPNTILPVSKMSAELVSHVRYPADLFKVQRTVLGQYHVTDPGSFYSQQDAWMIPNDPSSDAVGTSLQPPFYLTMQAPGQTTSKFSLYSTFIPKSTGASSRNVLTGYLMVDSDAGNTAGSISSGYGKLRLLQLPHDTVVPGPGQVQNSFTVDPDVSRLLNLLRQGSTKVLNGNLLTLPVGGGLLYVQPVYIKSTGETSYPLLKKVLVAFGDKIAFEDTLDGALNSLFGGSTPVTPVDPGTGGTVSQALKDALARAKTAMADKSAALAAGDWTAYGQADAALTRAINDALAASGN